MHIEVFKQDGSRALKSPWDDCSGQWYFHIKAANNKIIAQSEGYKSRRNALKTAKLIAGKRMKVVVV